MSLFQILIHGGWLMIPIALASIAVIALGVGRYLVLKRRSGELAAFLREWSGRSPAADRERFIKSCEFGPSELSEMAAIITGGKAEGTLTERLESASRGALLGVEKGLGALATLAAATPLIGFLGTVTGMIRAFMQIQNLGGNVNANVLAGGIWEALVTTAAGLVVGIAALIIHNYLAGMVKQIARMLEQCAEMALRAAGGSGEA